MIKYLTYLFILYILISCSPKLIVNERINLNLSSMTNCDFIIGTNEKLPDSSIIVADFETKGNFFTSMNYRINQSLDIIKNEISPLNYNVLKIDTIKFPGPFKSKSYDIKGKALYLKHCPEINTRLVKNVKDSSKRYIKLYRQNKIYGSGISYPIFINEQFLCGLDNNSKIIIEIDDPIKVENLQIESYGKRYFTPIDFKNDLIVYIKCKVQEAGIPITIIEKPEIGEKNFEKIKNML